jgi:hypothetical protein
MKPRSPLFIAASGLTFLVAVSAGTANATLVGFPVCGGSAVACAITTTPPDPVTPDPNDGILLAWDEVQNLALTQKLYVDRVFDPTAEFVDSDAGGLFLQPGTVVSSHYVQWDPVGRPSTLVRVQATIETDSTIFAFITSDRNLFDSDSLLGLPSLNYNDFSNRGLEASNNDTTVFDGNRVSINWGATSPGDWTRMITAFSPSAEIPLPAAAWLFGSSLIGLLGVAGRKQV